MKIRKNLVLPPLALLWFFAIIVFYYVTHKPFDPLLAYNLLGSVWKVLVSFLIITLCGGIGAALLPSIDLPPLTRLSFQAALGLGIIATGTLIIGATVGVHPIGFWVVLIGGLILLRRQALGWLRQIGDLRRHWRESDRLSHQVGILVLLLVIAALFVALAPPVKFDAMVSHLGMAQAYLNNHRVGYLPWHAMSGMPQNMEILFMWGLALGGASAATTLGWMIGILALLGLAGLLFERLPSTAAWVSVAALMAGSDIVVLLAWGYVDWLVFLFGLHTLFCLALWQIRGERRFLVLAGLMTGFAIGSKYTSGVLAIAGVAAIAWLAWRNKQNFLPPAFMYGLTTFIPALPWLLKNWITTGNPAYPFFIVSGNMSPMRLFVYQEVPTFGNWQDIFLLPFRAMYLGVDGGPGYMLAIGPLLLGLAALAWIGLRERDKADRTFVETSYAIFIAGWAVWAAANYLSGNLIQTRYYFSIFPTLAVLAGYGFHTLSRLNLPTVRIGRIASALLLMVLALNAFEVWSGVLKQNAVPTVLGLRSEKDYLADNLGWFQPAMQAVKDLPAGSKAQLIYEPRFFYCEPNCYPDEILDRWKIAYHANPSSQEIIQYWRKQGITHLLVYRTGMDFLYTANDLHHTVDELDALDAFLKELPSPVDFGHVYELYTLPQS